MKNFLILIIFMNSSLAHAQKGIYKCKQQIISTVEGNERFEVDTSYPKQKKGYTIPSYEFEIDASGNYFFSLVRSKLSETRIPYKLAYKSDFAKQAILTDNSGSIMTVLFSEGIPDKLVSTWTIEQSNKYSTNISYYDCKRTN